MLFSDLLNLPYDQNTGVIETSDIIDCLVDTPVAIVSDLFSDHGRRTDFQSMYGHLEISAINWTLVSLPAHAICLASINEDFRKWFEGVANRASNFESDGWQCIDVREDVIKYWSQHMTWMRPPIFFEGSVVSSDKELHLVEGHTRLGLLSGLVARSVIDDQSLHNLWVGHTHAAE